MLVTLNRREYEALSDAALIRACLDATIREIRGRDFKIKSQVYQRLESGQRALLMFQMLYGHSESGVTGFFCLSYILSQASVWQELRHGAGYFGDYTLLNLIGEMEQVYAQLKDGHKDAGPEQLEEIEAIGDSTLQAAISNLNTRLSQILPISVKLVGTYIRRHPYEFVNIED